MSKCDVCINKKYCVNHLDARTMCPQMDYVLFTPSYKTNYDRLISKTAEELAEWLRNVITECSRCPCSETPVLCEKPCKECLFDWLKSPVEEHP